MADTKLTKPGKAKREKSSAAPSSVKRPSKASPTEASSPPAAAATARAESGPSDPSRAKPAKAKSVLPSSSETLVKPSVKQDTAPVKPATHLGTGAKEPASDTARLPGEAAPARQRAKSKASGTAAKLPDAEETYRMIAEAAYYLAEKRNFAPGWEQEDWEAAKKDVMARLEQRKA